MNSREMVENGSETAGTGHRLSRRTVLAGAAGAAVATVVVAPGIAAADTSTTSSSTTTTTPAASSGSGAADASPVAGAPRGQHAVGDPRGSDIVVKYGRNKEGRFGTMFKTLTPFAPDDALLTSLAEKMVEARGPADDIVPDGLDNTSMPSGYVYFGQFVDHDITHDTTPIPDQQTDPSALTNFDSPIFDLGCLYGLGPSKNPELYDPARPGYLLLRKNTNGIMDLPRDSKGVAYVGDPRNDENLIVSQMQQAFAMLHNRFMDKEAAKNFAKAQQLTQWHYQWVIVNDYLVRLVGQQAMTAVQQAIRTYLPTVRTQLYAPSNQSKPMMPVEFSVAAYRWGHSAIRPEYEMHDSPLATNPAVLPIFSTSTAANPRDLRGSRPLYQDATVDWNYFFEIPGVNAPDDRNFARLIDSQVARPLHDLPDSVVAHTPGAIIALAQRNLLRGKRLGLPAGQDVAALMRQYIPQMPAPLTNAQLGLTEAGWGGKAPLWFYILKEAEILGGGKQLGPVGGYIVAGTLMVLLAIDKSSYWNAPSAFTPIGGSGFKMGDLLKLAGAPIINPPATG